MSRRRSKSQLDLKQLYICLANEKGTTFSDVVEWLGRTIATLQTDNTLIRMLETREVDSLFWIAMFGREPVPMPALDPDLVSSLVRVHSQAMIENYTPTCLDYPTKTWFPDRAA